MNDIGDMVLGINGQWMVRLPGRCANGHLLAENCIVAAQPCSCQDRHMSWSCGNLRPPLSRCRKD